MPRHSLQSICDNKQTTLQHELGPLSLGTSPFLPRPTSQREKNEDDGETLVARAACFPVGNIQRRMPKAQCPRNMSKIISPTLDHVKQGNTTKQNERLEDSELLPSRPTPLRPVKKKASKSEVESNVRSRHT